MAIDTSCARLGAAMARAHGWPTEHLSLAELELYGEAVRDAMARRQPAPHPPAARPKESAAYDERAGVLERTVVGERAVRDERTGKAERAVQRKSADVRERAEEDERTEHDERAVIAVRTVQSERAVPQERTVSVERSRVRLTPRQALEAVRLGVISREEARLHLGHGPVRRAGLVAPPPPSLRAAFQESTVGRERAGVLERTVVGERAVRDERTGKAERAVVGERTEPEERPVIIGEDYPAPDILTAALWALAWRLTLIGAVALLLVGSLGVLIARDEVALLTVVLAGLGGALHLWRGRGLPGALWRALAAGDALSWGLGYPTVLPALLGVVVAVSVAEAIVRARHGRGLVLS